MCNMKTYTLKNILLAAGVACCLVACTDSFREYNTNPGEATDDMLDMDNLRVGGFIPQIQRDVIPTSDPDANEFQRAQNLAGDAYAGYMGPIGTWNGGSNGNTYNLKFADWDAAAFSVGFTKVMPAWKLVADKTKEGFPETYAFVQILKVAAMHRLTDSYGPLPYTKFGHGGVTTPYDSQEVIYETFFKELDEAIGALKQFVSQSPDARPMKKFDMVYGGDYGKWLKFANSLKLRLAMRIVYVKPDLAKKYAEEAVKDGVIISNNDNAKLASANGISVFNPIKICWYDYDDTRMGANMESFLTGYKDARISKYFRVSAFDGAYHGVRSGVAVTNKDPYLKMSVPNIESDTSISPVWWMTASEICLLRAEGAIRGWAMGGTAQALYEQGIGLSFEQNGASLGTYLTDATSKPAAFIDKVVNNSIREGDKRLSTITIAWVEKASFELKLERIITQKWIALYPNGQEAWTEFRRTGYPKVFPIVSNKSGGTVSTDIQIRRISYPSAEYNSNKAEVEKAAALLGGPDNGGTKLWWDNKK